MTRQKVTEKEGSMEKRLYRSRSDRMIWGVCGGLANYFNVDPTVVRLITVLLLFLGGFTILAYIILAIVVPLKPSEGVASQEIPEGTRQEKVDEAQHGLSVAVAVILILIGILFLAGVVNLFWWFRWSGFWAFALVLIGVLVVLVAARRR